MWDGRPTCCVSARLEFRNDQFLPFCDLARIGQRIKVGVEDRQVMLYIPILVVMLGDVRECVAGFDGV